jgi:hypothetical protein
MTPDQRLQILIETQKQFHDLLEVERFIAIFGAVAAMIPGFLLFWLEHRRDRERIKVRRVISYSSWMQDPDRPKWSIDIAAEVTNLSQFPVTLTAFGYNTGGKDLYHGPPSTGYRYFDLAPGEIPFLAATKQLPAFIEKEIDGGVLSTDRERFQWPIEIPARTKLWIYAGDSDVETIGIDRKTATGFYPPSLPPKLRIFVKPTTRKSVYAEGRLAVRLLAAACNGMDSIRKAVSEMRQEH